MPFGDRLIREMATRFDEIGERFDFLAGVDRQIISENFSIEGAIFEILNRSSANFREATSAFTVIAEDIRPLPFTRSIAGSYS